MSLRKQIDALTKKRNSHLDAMAALSDTAANENRLFSDDEQKGFDKDAGEVGDIDAQLVKLNSAEQLLIKGARPAPSPLLAPEDVKPAFKAFPAQAFTRYVCALARSKGNLMQAAEIAKVWEAETPEVGVVLRAAVAAGTSSDPAWAGPLVQYQIMAREFIEYLRPLTVFGQLSGYRSVPFMIKIPRQTAGATANWVGEGLSKPVSQLTFESVLIPFAKMAVICVITQELAKFSDPSAEMLVRDDLLAAIAQFLDRTFLDDTVDAVANLRPASITFAAPKIPSSGADLVSITNDLAAAMLSITQPPYNVPLTRPVWIMNLSTAMFLATMRTAQGFFAFPTMSMGGVGPIGQGIAPQGGWSGTVTGGTVGNMATLLGIPVLASGNVPANAVTLLEQPQLMIADDNQILIDTSAEASLQLDNVPGTPPVPPLVSLWQQNMLGIKAERFIYWLMRHPGAIAEITGFPNTTPVVVP